MDNQVIETIKNACKKRGISRYVLSQKTGIDQSQLAKLWQGRSTGLSLRNLQKIIDVLGLKLK
jgi:transcriptional regulator with XRE-family HTH domain